MAIGERIHFIRNLRHMTQKQLGMAIGFDAKTADVRIAQYESGTRTPKDKVIQSLAYALDVSPQTLDVPNIDTYEGLMHTLFALEDIYNLKIDKREGRVCLTLDHFDSKTPQSLLEMFRLWQKEAEKLRNEDISEEEYNTWRYTYPQLEVERTKEAQAAFRAENEASD